MAWYLPIGVKSFSCTLFLKTDSLQIEQSTVVKLTLFRFFMNQSLEVNFTAAKIYIFLELKSNTYGRLQLYSPDSGPYHILADQLTLFQTSRTDYVYHTGLFSPNILRLLYNDFASSSSIALKDCKVLLSSIHCIDLFSPLCLMTFFSSAEIENSRLNSYFFELLSILIFKRMFVIEL